MWANATGPYVAATDGTNIMNVFNFRDALTNDYAEYVRSFIRIGTPDVQAVVESAIDDQLLWPEPIVQLNPSYRPGASSAAGRTPTRPASVATTGALARTGCRHSLVGS